MLVDLPGTSVTDFEARLPGTPQFIGEQKAAQQTQEKAGWVPQSAMVYINSGEMSTAVLELTVL